MGTVDVYHGGYLLLENVSKHGSELLASNICVIGMPLVLAYDTESSVFTVSTESGDLLGNVRPHNKLTVREALENGWTCRMWLSLVYYDNDTKLFGGEVVYQIYNVKPTQTDEQQALDAYAAKTSERLAAGERPDVSLTGTGYDTVIETGDWSDAKKVALPIDTARGGGKIVFKRKRGLSDKLTAAAMERRPGCTIAMIVLLLALLALIVLLLINCAGPR